MTNHETQASLTELEIRSELFDAMDGNLRMSKRRKLLDAYRDAVLAAAPAAVSVPPPAPQADAEAAVCICGHTEAQHFEDACVTEVTGCDCGDFLTGEAAREVIARWRDAAIQARADRGAILTEAADEAETVAESLRKHHEFERSTGALDVMTELRRLAAVPGPCVAGEQQNETVAYRNPDRPDVLLCREHGDSWWGLTPLTSEDLPDGGTCTWGMPFEDEVCGRDVLAEPRP